ncbi:Rab escort protein 1 [Tanacetum coccineum]
MEVTFLELDFQISKKQSNKNLMCVDIIDLLLHCKGSLCFGVHRYLGVHTSKDSGNYKGVKLVFGQEITCDKLVMVPSITITSSPAISESEDVFSVFDVVGVSGKVATGICITKSSLTANISSCLVIYPPRSLYPDEATSIWVIQLGSYIHLGGGEVFIRDLHKMVQALPQYSELIGKLSLHVDENTSGAVSSFLELLMLNLSKGVKPAPQAKHDEEVRVQKFRFAIVSPSAKLLIAQHILDASSIMASGERSTLLKSDVLIGTRQYSNLIID